MGQVHFHTRPLPNTYKSHYSSYQLRRTLYAHFHEKGEAEFCQVLVDISDT